MIKGLKSSRKNTKNAMDIYPLFSHETRLSSSTHMSLFLFIVIVCLLHVTWYMRKSSNFHLGNGSPTVKAASGTSHMS